MTQKHTFQYFRYLITLQPAVPNIYIILVSDESCRLCTGPWHQVAKRRFLVIYLFTFVVCTFSYIQFFSK